ncbi:MAG: proteasome accessory factor PafA2 family protein [Promethearchaeota archaeon]
MWQGVEQEYAAGPRPIELFEALEGKDVYVFKPDDSIPRAFLVNGGLCYIHSNLFEVCTPECRNPLEVVAYDKASEAFARLASWALEEMTEEKVHVYKTNIAFDPKGEANYTTIGSHENYLVKRKSYVEKARLLVPYLILRQVFCGAGGYVNGSYLISPRTIFPKKVYSETSVDYPILSTRDESHTVEEYGRAHVVNSEGARSEYTTFLKHSITGYVLKTLELDQFKALPEIDEPIITNKEISKNLDGDWAVPLKNGDSIKITDYLNAFYLEQIERVFENNCPLDHDKKALNEFKWVLRKLDEGLVESLDTSIEWVIKRDLCENKLVDMNLEQGLNIENAKEAAQFQYTAVTDPLYEEMVDRNGLKTLVSENDVRKAFLYPPENSRGKLRVTLAKEFYNEVRSLSWSYVKLHPKYHYYPIEFDNLDGWTFERIQEKLSEIKSKFGKVK